MGKGYQKEGDMGLRKREIGSQKGGDLVSERDVCLRKREIWAHRKGEIWAQEVWVS